MFFIYLPDDPHSTNVATVKELDEFLDEHGGRGGYGSRWYMESDDDAPDWVHHAHRRGADPLDIIRAYQDAESLDDSAAVHAGIYYSLAHLNMPLSAVEVSGQLVSRLGLCESSALDAEAVALEQAQQYAEESCPAFLVQFLDMAKLARALNGEQFQAFECDGRGWIANP